MGDSVTAGFGVRGGYGYFDRLAENPAGEFAQMRGICLRSVLPNLRTQNLAQSLQNMSNALGQSGGQVGAPPPASQPAGAAGLPGPDAPDLSGFSFGGDPVRWLWVVPITEEERLIAKEQGSASLISGLAAGHRSWVISE